MDGRLMIGLTAGAIGLLAAVARADTLTDFPEKILSQCGLTSGGAVIGLIYFASQLATTRKKWEAREVEWLKIFTTQNAAHEKDAVLNAKLEGVLLAVQHKR